MNIPTRRQVFNALLAILLVGIIAAVMFPAFNAVRP